MFGFGFIQLDGKGKKTNENYTAEDILEAEIGTARSHGHCMRMGTASTMACMVESLGLTLPGARQYLQ